jgi:hypothetical protein
LVLSLILILGFTAMCYAKSANTSYRVQ